MLRPHERPAWDDTKPGKRVDPARRHGRKKDVSPGRPFTDDDQWAQETRRACALALVKWMKGSMDLSRKFKTLRIEEADNMAEAITSEFIVRATRRIADTPAESAALADIFL